MESLRIPGRLDSLDQIASFIKQATTDADLDKKAAYQLRLAVDEIATNIIIHGYEEAGLTGDLHLSFEIDERTLTVSIADTATPYNPYDHALPNQEDLKQPLEQRQIGGLGIYLVLQGVDKFIYQRVDNQNHNIFIMNRPNKDTIHTDLP